MRRQEKAKQALGRQSTEVRKASPPSSVSASDFLLPAQEPELPRAVFIHDDAHGQGDGGQQEGTHGEGQVQHLILVLTDGPVIHLQVLLRVGFGGVGDIEAGGVS